MAGKHAGAVVARHAALQLDLPLGTMRNALLPAFCRIGFYGL